MVLDSEWKNLATQDLWCKVRPSLSTDVTKLMGRGRKDRIAPMHVPISIIAHVISV